MKYKYCPACDRLRPRTFMMDDRCEGCRGEALTIEVKRSAFGYAMYVADLIAAVMLIFYVAHNNYSAPFASFMSGVDNTLYLAVLFALIIGSFVLAYLDLGKTNEKARELVEARRAKIKD